MSNRLTLGAYWKPRRETIEQCANRLLGFMQGIAQCDEVFVDWYHLGRSRKDALKRKIDTRSPDELFTLLYKGRHLNFYKEVIENLGFSIGIWNGGEPGKEVSLHISCGQSAEVPGLRGNCVVISFPEDLRGLADPARTSRILLLASTCWEPDWAGIFSNEAMSNRDFRVEPFVDWMVYVPNKINSVPPPSSVAYLDNGGSLIVVQPKPPAVDNAEDQERIRRIDEILRQ